MFYASALKYVLGAQKNRLNETVFEYPQHIFWLRNKEHIFWYVLSTKHAKGMVKYICTGYKTLGLLSSKFVVVSIVYINIEQPSSDQWMCVLTL